MEPFGMDNFPEVINAPKSKTDEATRSAAAREAVDTRVSGFRRADSWWDVHGLIRRAATDGVNGYEASDYVFEIFTGCGPMHTDYTGMTPELVQKISDREKAMEPRDAWSRRGGPEPTGFAYKTLSLLSFLAVVVMVLSAILAVVGALSADGSVLDSVTDPALTTLLVSAAAFAGTFVSVLVIDHRQSGRSELALTPAEFELVKNARSRIGIDQNPDRRLDEAAAISATAAEVIHAIRQSPAWSSEHLDADRIQLDLVEEQYQITRACNQLRKLSKSCEAVQPDQRDDSPLADKLAEQAAEYRSLYDEAREAIIARIVALYVYRERLVSVEGLLANIAIASKAVAGNDDFAETFTSITLNREATKRIDKLSVGLDDLRERLSVELDLIRGEIVASAELGAPLVLLSERAA
ncbi:hypothetical protein ACT17_22970 [Mycolicibacterium conceptionense]|uniref:Uncharacterized protein n=1 Tax=Mycolicibacterium conceptionense TaxID=451644 RepID=A0A0J8U4E7_9MYCO|nr:hypothetical protein [Mycolicibacterium conceptionense]KMV15957.1 hypothetical protein ACT17_22970 [Mycolicibacterium conceptionense]